MSKSKKNNKNVNTPDQSFAKDPEIGVTASHPLSTKRITNRIAFAFCIVLFCVCGAIGTRLPYDEPGQHSANIAATVFFFALAAIFFTFFVLSFFSKIVVKVVKNETVGVYVGLVRNIVYLDNKMVYKGRNKNIVVWGENCKITVHIVDKNVYFD